MPASIVLSGLTLFTPDGRPLLPSIDLNFRPERSGLIGHNGVGKTTLLRLISGELTTQSGSLSVNGSVRLLRQITLLQEDETIADLFGATAELARLRRASEGGATADDLADADWTLEDRLSDALARFALNVRPDTRLASLSGGQRTRAGLAALIFADPDFLLLDEPTNNLDREGRVAVLDLISGWRGGAIVVSHDRELLETMDAIVELTSLGAARYGGNWSAFCQRKSLELAAAEHDLAGAEKRVSDVDRTAQIASERKARKDGAGKKTAKKGGLPRILLGARKNRSEESGSTVRRVHENRREAAIEALATARKRVEVLSPLTISLPATNLPAGKTVLKIDRVTAGYEAGKAVIRDLSLTITGPERVSVIGPNGSGKTTLLALIAGAIQPWSGSVRVMTDASLLDQTASVLEPADSIRDNFRRINPNADENACRAALARLMFRADAAHQIVSSLSGGQLLRAGLACVLGGPTPPQFLILDEPTNHLDIHSIEAVEIGLRGYDGALLVVSHDEAFLEAIGVSRGLNLQSSSL